MQSFNVFILYISLSVKFLAPVVILPYMTSVLSPDMWGLLSLVFAYMVIVSVVVEFGFGISGAREVALNVSDRNMLGSICISAFIIQLCISIIVIGVMYVIYANNTVLISETWLFSFGVLAGITQGFSFIWFFRGIGKFIHVAIFEIVSKVLFVVYVLMFVTGDDDVWTITLFMFSLNFVLLFIMLFLGRKNASFVFPDLQIIRSTFKEGLPFCIVRLSGVSITAGNTILISMFVSLSDVGVFSIAEKIMTAVRGLYNPIIDVFIPSLSKKLKLSVRHAALELQKIALIVLSGSVLLSLGMYLLSEYVVSVFLDVEYQRVGELLVYFSVVPLLVGMTAIIGPLWLVVLRKDKSFSLIVVVGSLFSLFTTYVLTMVYGISGAVISIILTYLLILLLFFMAVKYFKINPLIYR